MLIAPEEPESETLRVPVIRVFDGDGFLTRIAFSRGGGEREVAVRFGFIDAPEMGQPGGREARDFLVGLIGGQWLDLAILIKMDTGRIVDSHGRIVAVPYLRHRCDDEAEERPSLLQRLFGAPAGAFLSRNIELEIVLNGWAWVLDRYGPDERYLEALDDAQLHRRGIWALDGNVHPWEFKKRSYRAKRQRQGGLFPQTSPVSGVGAAAPCPRGGCEGHLVLRNGKFGNFYGCSNFPNCRYSRGTR